YPQYDELDRLRRQEWTFNGVTYVTTFDYDAAGCLTRIGYLTGSVVTQTCDLANRVTSVTLNGSTIVNNITYHPSGPPKPMTFGNGKVTTLVYDDRARAQTITSSGVLGLVYGYDGVDNVTSFDNTALPGSSRTMSYDNLNRILTSVAPSLWGS